MHHLFYPVLSRGVRLPEELGPNGTQAVFKPWRWDPHNPMLRVQLFIDSFTNAAPKKIIIRDFPSKSIKYIYQERKKAHQQFVAWNVIIIDFHIFTSDMVVAENKLL